MVAEMQCLLVLGNEASGFMARTTAGTAPVMDTRTSKAPSFLRGPATRTPPRSQCVRHPHETMVFHSSFSLLTTVCLP